jgi:hypothetical protein
MDATDALRSSACRRPGRICGADLAVDQAFFYRSVRDLYNRIFGALGLIIGVIVVFVVTNAMAMAIIERTREIGTLRALGTLPRPAGAQPRARRAAAGRRGRRCWARCWRWP